MAKNTGNGSRKGAVKGRSQTTTVSGKAIKRDTSNGRFTEQKKSDGLFKGVRREK